MSLNQKITAYIGNELNLDSDSREIVAYSLELLFHTIITMLLLITIGWLIGLLKETVVLLVFMYLFKHFAGGTHCSSAVGCILFSLLLMPSFAYLSHIAGQYFSINILLILTILSLLFSSVIVYRFAPVSTIPINTARFKKNRRIFSFLLILMAAITQIVLFALIPTKATSIIIAIDISIFWQAFMLTRQGAAFVNRFDRLLIFIMAKGGEKDEKY